MRERELMLIWMEKFSGLMVEESQVWINQSTLLGAMFWELCKQLEGGYLTGQQPSDFRSQIWNRWILLRRMQIQARQKNKWNRWGSQDINCWDCAYISVVPSSPWGILNTFNQNQLLFWDLTVLYMELCCNTFIGRFVLDHALSFFKNYFGTTLLRCNEDTQ